MKNVVFAAIFMVAALFTARADNDERPVAFEKLPAAAQTFLKSNFGNLTFAYAIEELGFFGNKYEVYYTDRTEVEFNKDGEWEKIERRYEAVPDKLVPAKILTFVKEHQNTAFIRSIERDSRSYEVELNTGMEMRFDQQFNLVGYDD